MSEAATDPTLCRIARGAELGQQGRRAEAWDLRALAAVENLGDERAATAGATGPVAAFYPSLHLNLGEDYRKVGDGAAARRHLSRVSPRRPRCPTTATAR